MSNVEWIKAEVRNGNNGTLALWNQTMITVEQCEEAFTPELKIR